MTIQEEFLAEYGVLIRKHGMFVTDNIYDNPILCAAIPKYIEEHLEKLHEEERKRQADCTRVKGRL